MRRVLRPQEFVNLVLAEAPKARVHVIKYQSHFPQMSDPMWRMDVFDLLCEQSTGTFKFSAPDDLDDEWTFTGTDMERVYPSVEWPLSKRDYSLIIALSFVAALVILAAVVVLIMFFGGPQ